MMQWIQGCIYLFKLALLCSLDKYTEVEWLWFFFSLYFCVISCNVASFVDINNFILLSFFLNVAEVLLFLSLKNSCFSIVFLVSIYLFLFIFILFYFISWRLITLQYCSGFCHTLTWISHGFTCIPHPNPHSHLPLHPIPLGLPSAPGPSACLMHPTWAGDLFHPR